MGLVKLSVDTIWDDPTETEQSMAPGVLGIHEAIRCLVCIWRYRETAAPTNHRRR